MEPTELPNLPRTCCVADERFGNGDMWAQSPEKAEALKNLRSKSQVNADDWKPRAPRIAIIGGGWYGCHLALILRDRGAEVSILEKNDDVFLAASGNNQFRLHYGFHYPRSQHTRTQIVESYPSFLKAYGGAINAETAERKHRELLAAGCESLYNNPIVCSSQPTSWIPLCSPIKRNLYAVAAERSMVDFDTFKTVMKSSGCPFEEVDPKRHGLANCEGVIATPDEQILFVDSARVFFRKELGVVGEIVESDLVNYENETEKLGDMKKSEFDQKRGISITSKNSNPNRNDEPIIRLNTEVLGVDVVKNDDNSVDFVQIRYRKYDTRGGGSTNSGYDNSKGNGNSTNGTSSNNTTKGNGKATNPSSHIGTPGTGKSGYATSARSPVCAHYIPAPLSPTAMNIRNQLQPSPFPGNAAANGNGKHGNSVLGEIFGNDINFGTNPALIKDQGVVEKPQIDLIDFTENMVRPNEETEERRKEVEAATVPNQPVTESFDWVIDCTYGQFLGIPGVNVFYEPCISLVYRYKHARPLETCSITVMDGSIGVSLYPYISTDEAYKQSGCTYYTLTSVNHTPICQCESMEDAKAALMKVDQDFVWDVKRPKFEENITTYYPRFLLDFTLVGWFVSVKTKVGATDGCASRECIVKTNHERIIHVLSGKINTIFEAEKSVLDIIANFVTLDGQLAQPH